MNAYYKYSSRRRRDAVVAAAAAARQPINDMYLNEEIEEVCCNIPFCGFDNVDSNKYKMHLPNWTDGSCNGGHR